ncbi:hypothetical protein [Nioella aestuarii]|uniref:hypothetical protein n=1 Tax=Nioella aestuarii TaxID=1662864 RepID=UPI003D7FAECA
MSGTDGRGNFAEAWGTWSIWGTWAFWRAEAIGREIFSVRAIGKTVGSLALSGGDARGAKGAVGAPSRVGVMGIVSPLVWPAAGACILSVV